MTDRQRNRLAGAGIVVAFPLAGLVFEMTGQNLWAGAFTMVVGFLMNYVAQHHPGSGE